MKWLWQVFRFRSLLLLKETCIIACIGILQEMGETKEHVLLRLKEKFKLSDTDANQYLEKYWKEWIDIQEKATFHVWLTWNVAFFHGGSSLYINHTCFRADCEIFWNTVSSLRLSSGSMMQKRTNSPSNPVKEEQSRIISPSRIQASNTSDEVSPTFWICTSKKLA